MGAIYQTGTTNTGGIAWRYDDEGDPTLGVREPRRPILPSLDYGARASLSFTAEPEAEAVAASARLTVRG